MKIKILTLFPDMFTGFIDESIIKRAIEKGVVEVSLIDIRQYSQDKHKHVDDTPCGGGAGMVMAVDVVDRCIKANTNEHSHIVMMTPQGETYNQKKALELSKLDELVLLCGHYEGFDERIRSYVDEEVSIGKNIFVPGKPEGQVQSLAVEPAGFSDPCCYDAGIRSGTGRLGPAVCSGNHPVLRLSYHPHGGYHNHGFDQEHSDVPCCFAAVL